MSGVETMKDKLKLLIPVIIGLILGTIFGIATKKVIWYISSGITLGGLIGFAFNQASRKSNT
jgi:hypothetical protein